MRLNPFDASNINVRGGSGGFPGGAGGGVGCGTLVIAAIAYFVFGADPMSTIGTVESMGQGQGQIEQGGSSQDVQALCTQNDYATEACNALQSLNQTWEPLFQQANIPFQQPTLVFYQGGTRSGCSATCCSTHSSALISRGRHKARISGW